MIVSVHSLQPHNEVHTHHCVVWEFWGQVGIDKTEQPVGVGVGVAAAAL